MLFLSPSPSPLTPGSTPSDFNWDAAAAVGTLLAVVVSLATLALQRRREHQRRQEEDIRQRRAQAGFISVWRLDKTGHLLIENRSEQPVYDAAACLLMPNPAADGRRHLPIGVGGGVARVVPARHQVVISSAAAWVTSPTPLLVFRDAHGATWERDDHGNLTELSTGVFEHFGVTPEHGYVDTLPQPL